MQWNAETRYKMLLEINNAVVTRTNREDLFQALAKELRKHVAFDRMAINLYDAASSSISYFAAADGVQPGGVLTRHSRPLADGAIARMVVQSRQPDDHRRPAAVQGPVVDRGHGRRPASRPPWRFPMLVRNRILGSIHFSFRDAPEHISELTQVLTDVSRQVAIAVDNMLAYTELEKHEPEPRAREGLPASEQRGVPAGRVLPRLGGHGRDHADHRAGGRHGRDRADHGRNRHRQGLPGALHPQPELAPQPPVRQDQLPGAGLLAVRKRALRPREGRLHRGATTGASAASSSPTAGPSSWTRSPSCRSGCRPSCCTSSRTASSSAWATAGPCRSTAGSSPRRTRTCRRASGRARSGRTSSTG